MLLDTHVLLWAIASPNRLSARVRGHLEDRETDVLVSAVSAWEVATKFRLGRLREAESLVARYQSHLATLAARELPVSSFHALKAGLFAVDHRDPFDRMLAAQAICEDVPLLTNDAAFLVFPGLATLW